MADGRRFTIRSSDDIDKAGLKPGDRVHVFVPMSLFTRMASFIGEHDDGPVLGHRGRHYRPSWADVHELWPSDGGSE